MRSRALAASALAAAAALAGCGGSSEGPNAKRFSGEQKKVAQVVDNLSSASRSGNTGKICKTIFTSTLATTIGRRAGTSCQREVEQQLVNKRERITVTALTVRTPNATAHVREQNGNTSTLTFVKQGGTWRINSIQ